MQPITVLFLAANPRSTPQLAIDEEMRAIEQKVRASKHRDALIFQSAWAARPDDLLQRLNQHRPHVVHFSGHGSSEGLSFVGDDGQEKLVSVQALRAVFSTLKDNIRLVVLNACYSRQQAQALVETLDCVVGMKENILDDAAITFASSFYRAIGFGRSVQQAFEQGIASLLLEGVGGTDIPELLVKEGVDAGQLRLVTAQNP
jgi:CHAT domain-containing protein